MLCHTDPTVVSVPDIWKASPSHSSVGRCMAPSLLHKLPLQFMESLLGNIWGTGAFENVDIAEFLYHSWCFSANNSFLKRRLKHLQSLLGRKCLSPFGGNTEPGITPQKCICGWDWVVTGGTRLGDGMGISSSLGNRGQIATVSKQMQKPAATFFFRWNKNPFWEHLA